MRGDHLPGPGETSESSHLDDLLIEAVAGAGAHIGMAYVLDRGGHVLTLESAVGLPGSIARAWARVRTDDFIPIALSVRDQRLIWVGGREELARSFPAAALALPYHFALVTAPVCSGGAAWGGLVLLWPSGRASGLTPRQREVIGHACDEIGELLRQAAEQGRRITPQCRPRLLDPRPVTDTSRRARLIALDCLNRLPDGYCCLDAEGRVSLVSAPAAELLAHSPPELLGRPLWESLPWLNDPAFEDRYRAAVISRQATRYTASGVGARQLTFRFYPGLSGVTVRVAPAKAARVVEPSAVAGREPRVMALHEMLHLATALARAVTAQEVVDLVANHVIPVYGAQALAILTWQDNRMRVAASRGYSQEAVEQYDSRPAIHQLGPPDHYEAAEPAFFATWEELRRHRPDSIRADGMSAWAFLPLATSGRPFGTCVLAYAHPHRFSGEERATLTALGGLIAQAFERARVYDTKHQLAQCLQASLLPHELPEIPGLDVAARYVPALPGMDIGGDFYDLIRLSPTMAAAVIGDVQGHDMNAAALMGQVRTAIHAHASAGSPPGEVLAHTNRLLTELSPDRFTSCLYLSLDLEEHTACLSSAGHFPPLLSRPGAATRIIDVSPGPLLGIDPDAKYATTDLVLEPGSILTLYTDGLIEEPGLDLGDAMAGLARRFAPPPGTPLCDSAADLVEAAAHDDQRTDDIAVLLLRDTGTPR
ncbi:PAS domain-containing protein [Nonomuraea sp. KC401]|uniref:SpoIIE family protein phosphatase n=1 Tax=unclassified Nonomuraea TaxID=2593643 RepID=UPI0010FCF2E1|nr:MULTISPECIES: SpoIIE family protein phosphatase [unclassified Nonomuraea]NBE99186.1 SpoIIE family protein phosphatase [Nonomuraea sp. K271]TLF47371.1 PAS domain-containing protein [Nonomuraea sp. KC401]